MVSIKKRLLGYDDKPKKRLPKIYKQWPPACPCLKNVRCIMCIDIAGDEVRCGLGARIKCSGSEEDKRRCPFWRNVIELGKLLEYGDKK